MAPAPKGPENTGATRSSLMKGIESLYNDPEYSDLTIKCGYREWRVHKSIVCTQSRFFAKASKGQWEEAKTGIIELHDEPPAVVEQMIQFLYKSTYDDNFYTAGAGEEGAIHFNLEVFIIADKFELSDLADLAESKFLACLDQLADYRDVLVTIPLLWEGAPADSAAKMRDQVIKLGREKCKIPHDPSCQLTRGINRLINDIPSFGVELVAAMSAHNRQLVRESKQEKESLKREKSILTQQRIELALDRADLEEERQAFKRQQDDLQEEKKRLQKQKSDLERQSRDLKQQKSDLDSSKEQEASPSHQSLECPLCRSEFAIVLSKKKYLRSVNCPYCNRTAIPVPPEKKGPWALMMDAR